MLVLVLAGTALAQTDLGQISGKVLDPKEAIVTDARVTVTNLATSAKQTATTNGEGLFTIGNVRVGEYEIAVEKEGFKKSAQRVKVEVAQRLNLPIMLQLGVTSETVEVTATNTAVINTISAEVSHEITSTEITTLPLLTRNPYALMELAPGSVNANVATGDYANGLGISNSGSRGRSINFLLDGSENNDTFVTGPSTLVPVDAIQEFKLQTNNMTSEFGRNALQANVATKSGTNNFHGSLSEFYRGSALSTQPVEEKSQDLPKGRFVRNVFGAAVGGPVIKDKTFFYAAFEGTRVRGNSKDFFYIPTPQFNANASANMNAYLDASGPLLPANLPEALTAEQLVAAEWAANHPDIEFPGYNSDPGNPETFLTTSGTANVIAADTPLFQHMFTNVPIDGGGGPPQNTWSLFARGDHQISDRTSLSLRYAWYRTELFPGFTSDSPYTDFLTGQSFRSQNATVTLTHSFTSRLFNESRFTFSRTTPNNPLGKASPNVACFLYGNTTAFGDPIVFGGYLPRSCAGNSLPAGGPQNTLSGYTGFTYSRGRNTWKFGGNMRFLRDNHTFGAFENGFGLGGSLQAMLDGVADADFRVAINPRGKFPGQIYDPAVDGPIVPPSFTRHYRYNEFAWYAEDSIKLLPTLTLTAGLRWEYFGVLHSPDGEKQVDSNFFLGTSGNVFQQIADGQFRQTNNLFNQDFNNFGPRVAIAWDVTGSARTVFRAGYGMFYDANFGNALFNVIQNPPAYAVVQAPGPDALILPNQYDTLANSLGGGAFTYASSARMLNKDMVTAYNSQWNATLEHDLMGKGVLVSLAYVGAKGDKLYSLNNLNQRGSCIMLDDSCGGNFRLRLNRGITGMNRRGNEAFSRYHSMQFQVRTHQIAHTGLTFNANYTWAHSIDNATSFFNDNAFDFNGNFGFGDPYNPASDKANSANDIRHRFALNYSWEIPWVRSLRGASGAAFGGWMLSGVLTAQTGGAFSVYENPGVFDDPCSASVANICYPVVTGPLPGQDGKTPALNPDLSVKANRTVLYAYGSSLVDLGTFCGGDRQCEAQTYFHQPAGLFLHRNSFRTPGYWNFDAAVLKNFRLPWESTSLQFRAEFFNLFNHSNLYADPNSNLLAAGEVDARRGVPPSHELYGTPFDRRNIQLGLRLTF
jgi:hypothetical protein